MARGRTPIPLDLPRPPGLQTATGRSKQDCISNAIREAILNRLLPGGSALPSTRTLATRWGVARGTVEASFDRLCSEGYIERIHGSGTRVSAVVPDSYLISTQAPKKPVESARRRPADPPPAHPAPLPENSVRAGIPFVARLADPELLRRKGWKRHFGIALSRTGSDEMCSTSAQGVESLRSEISGYLGKYRGIACCPDDIFITTGIRHSIDLFSQAILKPGDKVFMEDPGYRSAQQIFRRAGVETIDVPVDAEGFDLGAAARHPGAVAAYVTPAHQSPIGVTMAVSRRLELLDWAWRNGAWIIEDDYDGEFSYQSAPLSALKSLDVRDRVIYCGSFNKTLFSALRVGFMVVPRELKAAISSILHFTGRAVSVTEQLTLASFIDSGDFARHLRTCRHAYLQRRDTVLGQLERYGNGKYVTSGEHAGFHFALWLQPGTDETEFVERAARAGLALQPIHAFCRSIALQPGVVVGYTALTLAQARHSGKILGQLVSSF